MVAEIGRGKDRGHEGGKQGEAEEFFHDRGRRLRAALSPFARNGCDFSGWAKNDGTTTDGSPLEYWPSMSWPARVGTTQGGRTRPAPSLGSRWTSPTRSACGTPRRCADPAGPVIPRFRAAPAAPDAARRWRLPGSPARPPPPTSVAFAPARPRSRSVIAIAGYDGVCLLPFTTS
jgi:hypothetical protein